MPPKQNLEQLYSSYLNKEKGLGKEDFWRSFGDSDINPDHISITTYDKMVKDAQVFAATRVRNLAVLSKGIDLEHHGDNKELGDQMKRYLRKAFTEVNRNSNQNGGMYFVLDQMLHNGTNFGYSVAETVLGDYNEYGDGYVYPKKLKVLPPKTLKNCFKISDMGDLEAVIQNYQSDNEVRFESPTDLDRLVIYTHGRTFSNWYGNSDLKVIYKNWFSKDYIIKFWNIMLERYGAPFLLGKVSNPANIDLMNQALDSARTRTNFSIWANDDVSILESATAQKEAFLNAIKYHDSQIMLGKLVPLLILGLEQTGARALGDVHFRVFIWTVKNDQKEIADFMNLWIRKLIDMNFPEVDAYPRLTFPVIANEDLTAMSDALFKLINTSVVDPGEAWIRDMLSIPEDDILESTGGMWRSGMWKKKKDNPMNVKRQNKSGYDPQLKVFEKLMKSKEKQAKKIYVEYLDLQRKEVLENPDNFQRSKNMRAKSDELITKLKLLLTGWSEEVIEFDSELLEEAGLAMNTAFSRASLNSFISGLAEQSFKESVENIAYSAKDVVLEGQKAGQSTAEIATNVAKVYNTYERSQLDAVVRTIINDTNNAARLDLYKSNKDFVNGVRYDAILDKRTTDFCAFHDGMQISINNPDIEEFRPPNHFMCFIDGNTPIYTEKGWKSINDIEVGDSVLTHKGRFRNVTYVHHKQNPTIYDGEVYNIFYKGALFITVTPEHPILTNEGWTKAKNLTKEHKIITMAKQNNNYEFNQTELTNIECVELNKPKRLYNISVAEDESYIAKGIVTHNCRSIYTPITILDGPFEETYRIGGIYPDKRFGLDYFTEKYGSVE